MKVLYDYQVFGKQKYGGISRYYYELINHLETSSLLETELAIKVTNSHYLDNSRYMSEGVINQEKHYNDFLFGLSVRGKGRLYNMVYGAPDKNLKKNQKYSIDKLRQQKFDIFHPTYFNPYFLEHLKKKSFVLTIYDMIHEIFPQQLKPNDQTEENKRNLTKQAAKIIAISENTKRDVVNLYGIKPEKIEVVYLASSLESGDGVQVNSLPSRNYILFIGRRNRYKNFHRLVVALSRVKSFKDIHLVCAGGGAFNSLEVAMLRQLGIEEQTKQIDVDDKKLAWLYENAIALVVPSLYEGFGLPCVEAFGLGCPVICSNTGSLLEVSGDAAAYFDPEDEESIAGVIEKVLSDAEYRTKLVEKGKLRAQLFTWEKTALKTAKIYYDLCK